MKYELMVILDPKLTDKETKKTLGEIKALAEENGLSLVSEDDWGIRELAYKIQGHSRAYYVVMLFEGEGNGVPEFNKDLRIQSSLMRYLLIKMPEDYTLVRYSDELVIDTDRVTVEDTAKRERHSKHAEELSKKVKGQKEQSSDEVGATKDDEKSSEKLEKQLDAIMSDSDLKL